MMINDLRYCWGNNDNSKHYLGLEYSSGVYLLSPSTLWRRADALTRMKNGFYGIKADGTLHCWGQAHPCDTASTTPYTPAGMTNISDIAGYGTKPPSSGVNGGVCFIQSGSVRCLGNNSYGAMGRVPISMSDFSNFVNVSGSGGTYLKIAGRYPSFCAIRSDQSVQCWGRNNKGQLGDKTTVDSATVVNLNGN
jgi:hypothetical protein